MRPVLLVVAMFALVVTGIGVLPLAVWLASANVFAGVLSAAVLTAVMWAAADVIVRDHEAWDRPSINPK